MPTNQEALLVACLVTLAYDSDPLKISAWAEWATWGEANWGPTFTRPQDWASSNFYKVGLGGLQLGHKELAERVPPCARALSSRCGGDITVGRIEEYLHLVRSSKLEGPRWKDANGRQKGGVHRGVLSFVPAGRLLLDEGADIAALLTRGREGLRLTGAEIVSVEPPSLREAAAEAAAREAQEELEEVEARCSELQAAVREVAKCAKATVKAHKAELASVRRKAASEKEEATSNARFDADTLKAMGVAAEESLKAGRLAADELVRAPVHPHPHLTPSAPPLALTMPPSPHTGRWALW